MGIAAGARLGPYEIVAPLGAGGMGEVYRARDTRLDRIVAIKVLPEALAADPQLRERFEREARAVSSLQHPHICALFDVGREGDHEFLVLEYLEGETLADRLARAGPVPVGDALAIAADICDALVAAHRAGIVHRDLKPANVMLVRGGGRSGPPSAKLLDFGLAKAAAPIVAASGLSMLPTTPPNVTAQGTILGTFQYMAPEQIEGLEADARTDLFAFGALLFEMLTGRTAFEGKTRASLLGAILKDEPPRLSVLQPLAPAALDRIVSTCLAKDPDDRYQTARDLRRDLAWASLKDVSAPPNMTGTVASRSKIAWYAGGTAVIALAAAAIAWLRFDRVPPSTDTIQFTVAPPAGETFNTPPGGGTGLATQVAVSPDGRNVVFVAHGSTGYHLWLRPINTPEAHVLAGTDDAAFPFWSPDSRSVGYFASGKLRRLNLAGGPPLTVCDAQTGRGGAWNRDNVIVFSPSTTGTLMRVAASGGTPAPVTKLDGDYGETAHRFPQFLPDGRHFLYSAVVGTCCPATKPGRIKIGQLDSTDSTVIMEVESVGTIGAGYLLFARAGTLMAAPFDTNVHQITGEPIAVVEGINSEGSRYVSASASETGALVYVRGVASRPTTELTWYDRSGRRLGTVGERGEYSGISLSPDERRAAVGLFTGSPPNRDIWTVDVARGTPKRLTFSPEDDTAPIWSPDGSRIAFQANRRGAQMLRMKALDGAEAEESLIDRVPGDRQGGLTPTDWSADGRYILYSRSQGTEGSTDIWALPLFGDRKPFPVADTAFVEVNGVFSPDGRWVAYTSNEGGQVQVYAVPFPPTGARFQISRNGGNFPQWRRDGKELFYLSSDSQLMAVPVETTPSFECGAPAVLFPIATTANVGSNFRHYAVAKDGRFLTNRIEQDAISSPLTVVVNWPAMLQK